MIGIGLGLRSAVPGAYGWWPDNWVFGADFKNNRYMLGGSVVSLATLLSVVRASGHDDYAPNIDGDFVAFAPNTLRRTNAGETFELASERLSQYPATPFTDGVETGTIKSLQPGTFLGVFTDAARVASTGILSSLTHLGQTTTLLADTDYNFTIIYEGGTSGQARILVVGGGGGSRWGGPVGALVAQEFANGTMSNVVQEQFGDVHVIKGTFTPTNSNSNFAVGVGPQTATVGEDVVFIGGWLETVGPSSPILNNPGGTSVRVGDAATFSLAGLGALDITARYPNEAEQVLASSHVGSYLIDPAGLNDSLVSMIYGVASV